MNVYAVKKKAYATTCWSTYINIELALRHHFTSIPRSDRQFFVSPQFVQTISMSHLSHIFPTSRLISQATRSPKTNTDAHNSFLHTHTHLTAIKTGIHLSVCTCWCYLLSLTGVWARCHVEFSYIVQQGPFSAFLNNECWVEQVFLGSRDILKG